MRLQIAVSKDVLAGGYSEVLQAQLEGLKQVVDEAKVSGSETRLRIEEELEQLKSQANRALTIKTNLFEGTTDNSRDKVRRFARGLMRDKWFQDAVLATYIGILKADPKGIIESPSYFKNVQSARFHLIVKLAVRDTAEKNNEIRVKLTDANIQKYSEEIDRAIDAVRSIQYLDDVWNDLILICLANPNTKPDNRIIDSIIDNTLNIFQLAEVLEIDNCSATIKFNRGMTRKEFVNMWNALQSILQGSIPIEEVDWLKTRMAVLHYQEKMSYREIAKIYYPEYFEKRNRAREAIDLVRRTLERMDTVIIDVS